LAVIFPLEQVLKLNNHVKEQLLTPVLPTALEHKSVKNGEMYWPYRSYLGLQLLHKYLDLQKGKSPEVIIS
jgi:hypothetical protein